MSSKKKYSSWIELNKHVQTCTFEAFKVVFQTLWQSLLLIISPVFDCFYLKTQKLHTDNQTLHFIIIHLHAVISFFVLNSHFAWTVALSIFKKKKKKLWKKCLAREPTCSLFWNKDGWDEAEPAASSAPRGWKAFQAPFMCFFESKFVFSSFLFGQGGGGGGVRVV